MQIINLFPTPVAAKPFSRELTTEELNVLCTQELKENQGNWCSVDTQVLELPELKELRDFIQESADEYFKMIHAPKNDVKLRITQSWTNHTKKNQYHHIHHHSNSFISGVFYVKAKKDEDKINFHPANKNVFDIPTDNWNMYNSNSWWLPVETNMLLLFPSMLTHSVPETKSDEERISLAFNTFFYGYLGNDFNKTGLRL